MAQYLTVPGQLPVPLDNVPPVPAEFAWIQPDDWTDDNPNVQRLDSGGYARVYSVCGSISRVLMPKVCHPNPSPHENQVRFLAP